MKRDQFSVHLSTDEDKKGKLGTVSSEIYSVST